MASQSHDRASYRCALAKPNRLIESSRSLIWTSRLLDHDEGVGRSEVFETHGQIPSRNLDGARWEDAMWWFFGFVAAFALATIPHQGAPEIFRTLSGGAESGSIMKAQAGMRACSFCVPPASAAPIPLKSR